MFYVHQKPVAHSVVDSILYIGSGPIKNRISVLRKEA